MSFETATRNKYRFPSQVGMISVEDLWDLPTNQLDSVFKRLNADLKKVDEESLLSSPKPDEELTDKIAIVRHVFSVKVAEKEDKVKAKEKSERKAYLLSLLQQKQDETYRNKSPEELQALIDSL